MSPGVQPEKAREKAKAKGGRRRTFVGVPLREPELSLSIRTVVNPTGQFD